jgi:hypothetical protein
MQPPLQRGKAGMRLATVSTRTSFLTDCSFPKQSPDTGAFRQGLRSLTEGFAGMPVKTARRIRPSRHSRTKSAPAKPRPGCTSGNWCAGASWSARCGWTLMVDKRQTVTSSSGIRLSMALRVKRARSRLQGCGKPQGGGCGKLHPKRIIIKRIIIKRVIIKRVRKKRVRQKPPKQSLSCALP